MPGASILPPTDVPLVDLVPHRPPMLLIDALVRADEEAAMSVVTLRDGGAQVSGGRLPIVYIVEAMAQTAAAHLGALARWRREPAGGGYLVGLRDVDLARAALDSGDVVAIEVRRTFGEERFASYECRAFVRATAVASATVNVLRTPH